MYHPPPAGPYYGSSPPQHVPYPYPQYPPQAHGAYPYVPPTGMVMPGAGLVLVGQDANGAPLYGPAPAAPQDHAQHYQPVGQIPATAYTTPASFSAPAPAAAPIDRDEIQKMEPPKAGEDNKKPEAIFHILSTAQSNGTANVVDPALSKHGVKQCANLKNTFYYMKDINYVLCSPMFRSLQTVQATFSDRLNEGGVARAFIWSELRECANKDNAAAKNYKGVDTPRDHGHSLKAIKEQVKDMPMHIFQGLLPEDWELKNKTDDPKDRHKRAKDVRQDLVKFAQVVIPGGSWKGIQIKPHTTGGNVHIVVVSHPQFIHILTQGYEIPNSDFFQYVQYRSYHFPPPGADGFEDLDINKLYEFNVSKYRSHIPDAMTQREYEEKLQKEADAKKAAKEKKAEELRIAAEKKKAAEEAKKKAAEEAKKAAAERQRAEARRQEAAQQSSSSGGGGCC